MTKLAITHRWNGSVIFEADLSGDLDTADHRVRLGAAVEMAVAKGANLADANLADADLADANLARANLAGAYLEGANLARANLADADLEGANLARANLAGADLAGAGLEGANLADAYLAGAYLADAKNISAAQLAQFSILPEGTLIGWKKLRGGIVAKLEIPAEARRVNAYSSRKCRAEYARVLALFRPGGEPFDGVAISQRRDDTRYVVGEIVRPDSFDPDPQKECAGGIHFFITRPEAEAY